MQMFLEKWSWLCSWEVSYLQRIILLMGLLISCWFIIESMIIPDGFLKWFYLRFYIHPFFLVCCQLFLWLRSLIKWIHLLLISYPFRIICFLTFPVFRFFSSGNSCVGFIKILSDFITRVRVASNVQVEPQDDQVAAADSDDKCSLVLQSHHNRSQVFHNSSCSFANIAPLPPKPIELFQNRKDGFLGADQVLKFEEHVVLRAQDNMEDLNSCSDKYDTDGKDDAYCAEDQMDLYEQELDSTSSSSVDSSNSSLAENGDMTNHKLYPPPSSALCMPSSSSDVVLEGEVADSVRDHQDHDDSDPFHNKYIERMRWFDLLNYDRTCGISTVLNEQLVGSMTPSPFWSCNNTNNDNQAAAVDMSTTPSVSWSSKENKKRLLRSLESDFEMVYVGQTCLSWEALHHQYTKIKARAAAAAAESSSSSAPLFYSNVAGEFQKFQVLLERFLEDERCEGERIWNYVRGRLSFNSLLQVPQIPGFPEKENVDDDQGEGVKQVLEAIERCIEAFWIFVKTDNKKPAAAVWWKLKSSLLLWTSINPVEDPRDSEILYDLKRDLRKKEVWLKDVQGKQRCWLKRVANPVDESHRKEMLFTMIDLKLVSRVLQMSTVSSSQLKWCREKLLSIEFKQGKVFRACTTAPPLFPPS